jgi:uncharacterized RDD family membrane protein YckC
MESPEPLESFEQEPAAPKSYLAGFWARIAALLIDCAILSLFGFFLAIFLQPVFVRMGQSGKLIGFAIAALYFSIFNSAIGNGQTIGKRMLNIRVVRKDGALLSPPGSFARYLVLALPYFLNGAYFESGPPALGYLLTFVIFGMGFSILYLAIFNRVSRQSLHDMVVGTYVINAYAQRTVPAGIPRLHYIAISLIMTVPLIFMAFASNGAKPDSLSELMKARRKVLELPFLVTASINDNTVKANGASTTNLIVKAYLKSDDVKNDTLALQVARVVLANDSASHDRDRISIVLGYGFDIGIASLWKNCGYVETPMGWITKANQ